MRARPRGVLQSLSDIARADDDLAPDSADDDVAGHVDRALTVPGDEQPLDVGEVMLSELTRACTVQHEQPTQGTDAQRGVECAERFDRPVRGPLRLVRGSRETGEGLVGEAGEQVGELGALRRGEAPEGLLHGVGAGTAGLGDGVRAFWMRFRMTFQRRRR